MTSEARFCRRCGQPLSVSEPGSVTEATTRFLETPERPRSPGFAFNEQPPQPLAYPGSQTQSVAGASTKSLEPARPHQKWMLTSALLVVLLAIVTAALIFKSRSQAIIVTSPPAIPKTEIPPVPPPPPPALPPNVSRGVTTISPALIYPGSRTTMEINEGGGKSAIRLETSDPIDKVAAWYISKLKPAQVVNQSSSVILVGDGIQVVINPTGDGTDILLHQGED